MSIFMKAKALQLAHAAQGLVEHLSDVSLEYFIMCDDHDKWLDLLKFHRDVVKSNADWVLEEGRR